MQSKQDILEKAQKLMALAKAGATQGEVDAATEALSRLMAKHNIEMAEVMSTIRKSDVESASFTTQYKDLPPFYRLLAGRIADAMSCQVIGDWDAVANKKKMRFFGVGVDAQIACYLFDMLYYKLWKMCDEEMKCHFLKGEQKNVFRSEYIMAASKRIQERLKTMYGTPEENKSITALVVVKMDAINAAVSDEYPKLYTGRKIYRRGVDDYARAAGDHAGRTVGLSTALKQGESNGQKRLS